MARRSGSLIPARVTAAIAVACLLAGRLNGAVLAVAAVPAATGLNDGVFKPLVHRTYLGVLTYPSGHTATIFALAATVRVLLLCPPQPASAGALRALIPVAAACWEAWWPSASSACDGTTSPIPWPAPLSVSVRSAVSRSSWTCRPSGAREAAAGCRPFWSAGAVTEMPRKQVRWRPRRPGETSGEMTTG